MKKILLGLFLVIFITGCTSPSSLEGFETLCKNNHHMWMRMAPLEESVETSPKPCWGCMPDAENHYCDVDDYLAKVGVDETHDENMDGMMHGEPMKAHAGEQKSTDIHQYRVQFDHPALETGKEMELAFTILDLDSGKPVTDLEIMHEKPMHMILVRDDLKHFDHIHPRLDGTRWVVPYTFRAGGDYRIWIDFMKGMGHLVDFDVRASGPTDVDEPDKLFGLEVRMERHDNTLQFKVFKGGQALPITGIFLGAAAHLVMIDDTLDDFSHAHDDKLDGDHTFIFTPALSHDKFYKIWLQFIVDGKVRTAAFSLEEETP